MKKSTCVFLCAFFFGTAFIYGQDTVKQQLKITVPLIDFPQNISLPHHYPSMNQALEYSNDFYELGFWGIDALGDKLFVRKNQPVSKFKRFSNQAFKYILGLGFSYYGSELPVPLGVWAHEEFHRSALGVKTIASKNGNWLFTRWDGTVFGVSDVDLSELKKSDLNQLLYSYVAGVQYEVIQSERSTLDDFYKNRSLTKNSLLLYNAYYVYNYFNFSTSAFSDSVKILAPAHENKNPAERDFAGADLTAWAYDMFNPGLAYTVRDSFPKGEGVNRRIGFNTDLSPEARNYLSKQKTLSLLNFVNPAIFFINKVKLSDDLSFLFFMQYAPTHFGNDIAAYFPVKVKKFNLLLDAHNYSSRDRKGAGIGLGLYDYQLNNKIYGDVVLHVWDQPTSFLGTGNTSGGALALKVKYAFTGNFSCFIQMSAKTKGWLIGDPYLDENISGRFGLSYQLLKK